MSADDHDRAVAVTSHAVQVVDSALAAAWAQLPGVAGDARGRAFDEVLRLAGSNADMWEQILAANSGSVSQVLLQLADALTEVADSLAAGSAASARELIEQGNDAASQM
jgi:prephenate dehydrogenase